MTGPAVFGAPADLRVAILGLGLVGGSVAKALHERGVTVLAWDTDPTTRDEARATGLTVLRAVEDLAEARPDLVVLAVPLRAMAETAGRLAPVLPPGVAITDVGSVKGPVREAVTAAGLAARYVGAHPMAGTEHSGFGAASADMFVGVRWAVTLDGTTDLDAFLLVTTLITDLLGGTVHPLTDEVHDEAAALISHVPHVVATELLNLVAHSPIREVAIGLSAGSFRDGTRVARTTPRRTQAMVTDNAAWVSAAVRVLARDLERLADALDANAPTDEFFDRADVLRRPAPAGDRVREFVLDGRLHWQRELTSRGRDGARVRAADTARYCVVLEGGLSTD